jgi:eukaryotic-like serine/threonine-protein kinase
VAGTAHGHFDDTDTLPGITRPGDMIGAKYRVEDVIAVGGMGTVVAAIHTELDQRVAIKLMPKRAAKNDGAVQRFLREARTAASIDNDHVVRVFDVGRTDRGVPFMVMERLEGKTLAELIFGRNPLPIEEALDYVMQACVAIAACHANGIVHRDLKPENMMVLEGPGQRGHVKLLDFGISKIEWLHAGKKRQSDLTTTKDVFGTPTHMSPEQVRSAKNADARSDIWALGVVLYEVLTGLPPFMADSLSALSAMIVADAPRRPIERRPELPAGLDAIVMRCLEKKPEARPASIAELAELLAPYVAAPSLSSLARIRSIDAAARQRPLPAQDAPAGPKPRETFSAWGTTSSRRERKLSIVIGVSLGALVFVLGVGLFGVRYALDVTSRAKASASALTAESIPRTVAPPAASVSGSAAKLDAGAAKPPPPAAKPRGPLDERH